MNQFVSIKYDRPLRERIFEEKKHLQSFCMQVGNKGVFKLVSE